MEVLNQLKSGQIKVFKDLQGFWTEFRRYARDEKGQIRKKNDHSMDAFRYLIVSGRNVARNKPSNTRTGTGYYGSRPDWKTV